MVAVVDSALKLDRLQVYLQRLRLNPRGADLWVDADGAVHGRVLDAEVSSSFEPIRTPDGEVVAAQALAEVRPFDGGSDPVARGEPTPWKLFSRALSPDDLVAFDRRCRTVHTLNFFSSHPPSQELFLRVHDRLLTAVADLHGRAFKRVLDSLGIPMSRIVIELPPAASAHPALLAHVIANYRLAGFRVAINPQSFAEIERALAAARIDFVRLDARRLEAFDPGGHSADQRLAALRALDTSLLLFNVKDDADAAAARAVGARYLQGA